MPEIHDMILEGPMENSVGEWVCYVCGRRLLVRREPNFEKVVLQNGDELATHVSMIGNKRVINVPATDQANQDVYDATWLGQHGISWSDC